MNNNYSFQFRSSPGTAWPALPPERWAGVWSAYCQLDKTQWLDPIEIEQNQLSQVRLVIQHAMANVPYYRKTFSGIVPEKVQTLSDFRLLPVLSRKTYQERFSEFCAESLPVGQIPTGESSSSGTSGIQVKVLHTNRVNLWWLAFCLRDLEWCNINPVRSIASIRPMQKRFMDGVTIPNWGGIFADFIVSGPNHVMELRQHPKKQLEWLRQLSPNYLLSYPSNLEYLASLIQESGHRIDSITAIQSVGETVTNQAKNRIEEAFAAPLKNMYTCSEFGYLASQCPSGNFHVHSENVILEVLDDEGKPCLPGELGQVTLTTLNNFRTPLIRYQILDEAIVGSCSCGRGLPVLSQVNGKRRPLLHLPNGRAKNSVDLAMSIAKIKGIRQYQVVQNAIDDVLVKVVPGADWNDDGIAEVRQVVTDFFESNILAKVDTMERMELSSGGKLLSVICKC
jgi:phenylacetate-CoA ligase